MLELLITKRRHIRVLLFIEHILLIMAVLLNSYLAIGLICFFAAYKLMAIDRATIRLIEKMKELEE